MTVKILEHEKKYSSHWEELEEHLSEGWTLLEINTTASSITGDTVHYAFLKSPTEKFKRVKCEAMGTAPGTIPVERFP